MTKKTVKTRKKIAEKPEAQLNRLKKEQGAKSAAEKFKEEFNQLRPLLPEDWKEQLIIALPYYNTIKGSYLLKNILANSSTDVNLLEALKIICKSKK